MIKPKVYIRADGNSEIGLGHVIRSLALAEMLKADFECVFATRFLTDYIHTESMKACNDVIKLPETDEHFDAFLSCLSGEEIVVLDNYFFATDYQRSIKNKGCKLVCIDDMHDKHYVSDVVINHAEGLNKKDFSVESFTKLCLGFNYALLRKEFIELENRSRNIDVLNKMFVCFGGVDVNNLSQKIIKVCTSINYFTHIDLVVGDAYENENEMRRFCTDKPFLNIHKNLDVNKMVELMLANDLAIVPASTIAIETFKAKMYLFTGFTVDNQKNLLKGLQKYSQVYVAGDFNTLKENQIREKFEDLIIGFKPAFLPAKTANPKQKILSIFNSLL